MLNNKRVNIVLSVIIAICLWTYVVGETNPTIVKTYKNIPIKVKNEKVLEDQNLALGEMETSTVSITVKGSRNRINKILNSDISAYIDLEEAEKGENVMRVHIQTPFSVEYEDSSVQTVKVNIENMKTKDIPVVIDYDGADDSKSEDNKPVTVKVMPETVTVKGAESRVDEAQSARGSIEANLVSDEQTTFNVNIKAVDSSKKEVPYVNLSQTVVTVQSQLTRAKTVPLKADVTDNETSGLEKNYEVPETITVMGSSDVLENVEYIKCEDIDISDVTESCQIQLKLIMPEGVSISKADKKKAVLTVTVEKMSDKTVTIDSSQIDIKGLGKNLVADIENGKIEITVSGKKSDLSGFSADKVSLSVNLKDIGAGTHRVEISAKTDFNYGSIRINPQTVKVTIKDDNENDNEEN